MVDGGQQHGTLSSAVGGSAIAGALFGVLDVLLTLRSEPYPGSAAFLLGYAIGPVLIGVGWACSLGVLIAVTCRLAGRSDYAGSAAIASVAIVWLAGLLLTAWHEGQTAGTAALTTVAGGLFAVAFARFARDLASWLDGRSARSRRRYWTAIAAVLIAASAATVPSALESFGGGTGPCSAADTPVPDSPNVLLISIDTLRADVAQEMNSYRKLAQRGVEFRQHLTLSPWTLPSVASLLTGLPLAGHKAGLALSSRSLLLRTPIGPDLEPISKRLGSAGYRTHAIVTNPYLTGSYGADQGFCSFENVTIAAESVRGLSHTTPIRFANVLAPGVLPQDRAGVVADKAAAWIGRAQERPFFLWVHFLDPHAPYGDRDGASTSLTFDLMAMQRNRGFEVPFRDVGALRAGEYRPGSEERRRIVDLYREDVAFVDGAIDDLLAVLEGQGIASKTVVVLTADHGEEFWDHGGTEHGRTLFEEVLRVPLVIVDPKSPPTAASVSTLTSVLDIVPTILALAGIAEPSLPGRNLLADSAADPGIELRVGNLLFGPEWQGIRTPRLKYLRSEHGEERLFELGPDASERTDASGFRTEELALLRSRLAVSEAASAEAARAPNLSEAERRALRNLGYLR